MVEEIHTERKKEPSKGKGKKKGKKGKKAPKKKIVAAVQKYPFVSSVVLLCVIGYIL